ncbi:MAG: hypothetical protein LC777_16980, partial [Actinobacteria bacterium]|nr:hypothetical protein [Actinomycetota bacterium]
MRERSLVVVVSVVAVLVLAAFGLYLYDHGRRDRLASGIKVGNVDVGGMRATPARDKVRHELTLRANQAIVVQWHNKRFELNPR